MPKQHRWNIKRELTSAVNNLNTAQNHIIKYGHEFEEPHPDIYKQFCDLVHAIGLLKDAITAMCTKI